MKQAILFLSDKSSQWIINNFQKLASTECETIDVFFLYHERNHVIPEVIQTVKHYTFTNNILYELDYMPLEEKLIPGSNHFPLLKFYLDNRQYDYYWMIEDDVCFSGNWCSLFKAYQDDPIDFISTHISKFEETPYWNWWYTLNISDKIIQNKVCSFNPIYRLSNRALELIDKSLKNGWSGHHEVVIPTLLHNNGFKIIDMGGTGSFVPIGYENHFYTYESMSHLPVEMGNEENRIYHPIKEKKEIDLDKLKKYCVISAVGKNSLHQEWIKESPDFDLHIIIYDDSYNKFYNDTDFISYQKGNKFKLVYDYLLKNPVYLEKYEYFFVPDDDIQIDTENITDLFERMQQYNLLIAQPALSDSYYTYERTMKDKFCILRYTNFVEMMVPCFSREALKKVLFTFNENNSGWGIEFHWPKLIGFSGREMAIIDNLQVVHTRPIQSFNQKNVIELNDYLIKYGLNREIKDYGVIAIDSPIQTSWKPIITKRETYNLLENQLAQIAHILSQTLQSKAKQGGLLDGTSGISLFFLTYYRLTGKRKYLDQALSIVDWSSDRIRLFKNDLSFSTGLPGFSWYIEYLAQQGYIENETDELLEDICEHLKISDFGYNAKIDFPEGILGYGQHYLARLSNSNFDIQKELNRQEKDILSAIISSIGRYYQQSFEQKINGRTNYKVVSDCILFLCKASQLLSDDDTIRILIEKYSIILKKNKPSKNFSAIQKGYTLYSASKVLNDNSLRKLALCIAYDSPQITKITSYQTIYDVHLLNRLYQETGDTGHRNSALYVIQSLFASEKANINNTIGLFINKNNKVNTSITNGLCGLGLIMISTMADFIPDWDRCILL